MLLPAVRDAATYDNLQCYFGYAVWQDLAARAFAGFLVHDSLNLLMYYPLNQQIGMVIHHFIFLTLVLYSLSGSYFKCEPNFDNLLTCKHAGVRACCMQRIGRTDALHLQVGAVHVHAHHARAKRTSCDAPQTAAQLSQHT